MQKPGQLQKSANDLTMKNDHSDMIVPKTQLQNSVEQITRLKIENSDEQIIPTNKSG